MMETNKKLYKMIDQDELDEIRHVLGNPSHGTIQNTIQDISKCVEVILNELSALGMEEITESIVIMRDFYTIKFDEYGVELSISYGNYHFKSFRDNKGHIIPGMFNIISGNCIDIKNIEPTPTMNKDIRGIMKIAEFMENNLEAIVVMGLREEALNASLERIY